MNKTKKKGFTLIELIIVVAIIGILAAIAVPKFNDVQKKSKISADIASAKVIADAAILSQADGNIISGGVVDASSIISNKLEIQGVPELKLSSGNKFFIKVTGSNITIHGAKAGDTLDEKNQIYPKPEESKVKNDSNPYYPEYGSKE